MSNGELALSPRKIPVPTTISPEAQRFLAQAAAAAARPAYPAPDDKAGWRKHLAEGNRGLEAVLNGLVGNFAGTTTCTRIGQADVYISEPAANKNPASVYLDVHGGALVLGAGEACKLSSQLVASRMDLKVHSVDYRMPPDHPFPAGLDDCVAAYRALLNSYPPSRIIVGGASAGGNLAAALVLRARDEGLPLPAGLVLLSPELDLTESGDTFEVLADIDVVLRRRLTDTIRIYADGHELTDAYVSPLFGDFSRGFPPTFLQSGTRDLFLSNAVRFQRALRRADIPVDLQLFEAMPHGGFFGAPEDIEMWNEARRFSHARLMAG